MVSELHTEPIRCSHEPAETIRVLVVDDQPDIVRTSARMLQAAGFHVSTAFNGNEALRLVAEFRPHVALLDIGLPDIDGNEVARRLRADPRLRAVTLIAITAYGSDEDRRLSDAAGFDHFFFKPASFCAVLSLIGSLRQV